MNPRRTRISRCLTATALLMLMASAAVGAPPSSTATTTFAFADAATDRIASDGLGPYDASLDGSTLTFTTSKRRSIWFDFSDQLLASGTTPEGPSTAGSISQVTVTVDLTMPAATFRFGGSGGDQILNVADLQVAAMDDDGDGQADRFLLETTGAARHDLFLITKKGGRGTEPGMLHSVWQGRYAMPWSAVIAVH